MSSTRRDAQERVAAYYESCMRELIEHVGIARISTAPMVMSNR